MALVTISDVHIQSFDRKHRDLFLQFLNHETVRRADQICLLGDIFDVFVGPHREYFYLFEDVFVALKSLLFEGKTIYYVEGNHDIHFEKFFNSILSPREKANFHVVKGKKTLNVGGVNIQLSHGDEYNLGENIYPIYRAFIGSHFMSFLVNRVLSFEGLHRAAENASSRSRNKTKVYDTEKLKNKMRDKVQSSWPSNVEILLCGHVHILDAVSFSGNRLYMNNGFFPKSKKFISVGDDGKAKFIQI